MKVLLIFLSALVLVAQGKVTPSKDEPQPDVVAVEVGAGEETNGVFAEEAPEVLVLDAEEEPQEAYETEYRAGEHIPAPETGVYVPMATRVCTDNVCASICGSLGYKYGMCISNTTCRCYN